MYKCESPICNGYETKYRNQINFHHIVPRELKGPNKNNNLICVCPNCHSRIFINESTNGIHAIKTKNSIIINGWLQSTAGKVLEYIDKNGDTQYHGVKNG